MGPSFQGGACGRKDSGSFPKNKQEKASVKTGASKGKGIFPEQLQDGPMKSVEEKESEGQSTAWA